MRHSVNNNLDAIYYNNHHQTGVAMEEIHVPSTTPEPAVDLDDQRDLLERSQEFVSPSILSASRLTDELQRRQQLQDQARSISFRVSSWTALMIFHI